MVAAMEEYVQHPMTVYIKHWNAPLCLPGHAGGTTETTRCKTELGSRSAHITLYILQCSQPSLTGVPERRCHFPIDAIVAKWALLQRGVLTGARLAPGLARRGQGPRG